MMSVEVRLRPGRLTAPTLVLLACAGPAHAWGERGHDIVTRVAVRLVAERLAPGTPLAAVFSRKELMLGHLSNVPDIVWRSQGPEVDALNDPTHFLDLEYLALSPSFEAVPRELSAAFAQMKALCARPPAGYVCPERPDAPLRESSAGTAPWRIDQLHRLTVEAMRAGGGEPADVAAVDRALTTAGLLSHFVGDLGNPYHATRDYNGWESGAGGVHAYFESAVVGSYRLALEQEVLDAAAAGGAFARVLTRIPAPQRAALGRDPTAVALALALDSFGRLPAAARLDRRVAILKPRSVEADGQRVPAERRDPAQARFRMHGLVVERLATAAEVLARLWLLAWEEAGRPSFKDYRSYAYPVAPQFIPPDYLAR
jgi:hypothetical protein